MTIKANEAIKDFTISFWQAHTTGARQPDPGTGELLHSGMTLDELLGQRDAIVALVETMPGNEALAYLKMVERFLAQNNWVEVEPPNVDLAGGKVQVSEAIRHLIGELQHWARDTQEKILEGYRADRPSAKLFGEAVNPYAVKP